MTRGMAGRLMFCRGDSLSIGAAVRGTCVVHLASLEGSGWFIDVLQA